jgi:hypothetical protein
VSLTKARGRGSRRWEEVRSEQTEEAKQFFGDADQAAGRNWKVWQLCKQVERAASFVLAECRDDALLGAAIAEVAPAPDAGRLRVAVVLPSHGSTGNVIEARAALARAASSFRAEVARSIHRKRVPEIVFEVCSSPEAGHE